jgi:hypothetical protein
MGGGIGVWPTQKLSRGAPYGKDKTALSWKVLKFFLIVLTYITDE